MKTILLTYLWILLVQVIMLIQPTSQAVTKNLQNLIIPSEERQRRRRSVRSTSLTYAVEMRAADELPRYVCPAGQWACINPTADGRIPCIPLDKVCDYKIDCPGAEDEDAVQCAHSRAIEAKMARKCDCEELESRLTNLERGHLKQSCELVTMKQSLQSHRHSRHSAIPIFDNHERCPNFGFSYDSFNTSDPT